MIGGGRAAGTTIAAGSAIAKVTPRPLVEAGRIQTTVRAAGSGTAKAILKLPAEAGKIQITARVGGSGTVKVIPKLLVEDGTTLTTERAAGLAIRKDTLAPPARAGAKNPPVAAAIRGMIETAVEAAANMRTRKPRDERRNELRRPSFELPLLSTRNRAHQPGNP